MFQLKVFSVVFDISSKSEIDLYFLDSVSEPFLNMRFYIDLEILTIYFIGLSACLGRSVDVCSNHKKFL